MTLALGHGRRDGRSPPIGVALVVGRDRRESVAGSTAISCRRFFCRAAGTSLLETAVAHRDRRARRRGWRSSRVRVGAARRRDRRRGRCRAWLPRCARARRERSWRCASSICARPSGCCPKKSRGGVPIRGSAGRSCRRAPAATTIGGRTIDYAIDAAGYRVRRARRAGRSRAADDRVYRRVGDVRRRADLGRKRSPRRSARCWACRARTSRSTATATIRRFCGSQTELPRFRRPRRGGVALHDGAVRPQSRRRSAASGAGFRLAAGGAAHAADVARRAARAVSPRRRRRAGRLA